MASSTSCLLSWLVFLPLLWALVGLCIPTNTASGLKLSKLSALIGSLVTFAVSICVYQQFDPASAQAQLAENHAWIPSLGVGYRLGIDGISLWLVLLTTFLTPIVILSSWESVEKKVKAYYALILALETAMLGTFLAMDAFLFYTFWEAMLIPMYFLVGIWGGKERIYAAMKLFLYTMAGSLLMLVAIFYLAYQYKLQTGLGYSMYLPDLYMVKIPSGGYLAPQSLLFLAFTIAFAIKVPLFPLHTWLPDAHVQAPTAGSVILAGVLLKMGGYGLIRFVLPLFPDAVRLYQTPMLVLGTVAITYGALIAWVQTDVKKLVAYSSVSHMGYVVLGIFALNPTGMTGAVYQMLCHGISTSGLFLLVGMIYDRRHTREMSDFGGISKVMPLFAIAFMIILLSSAALPGTNGFIGEFMILLGLWQTSQVLAAFAALGVILGAVYLLFMFQKVMLGPVTGDENKRLKDLSLREVAVLVPLLIAVFWMGFNPGFWFKKMQTSIDASLVPYSQSAVASSNAEKVGTPWNP
ncbi:NADH-quinone oxidoreductase subunit M [bacterium]|nr:NADH-quinone oxidoreductase subunit M [bacterium]